MGGFYFNKRKVFYFCNTILIVPLCIRGLAQVQSRSL